MNSLARSVSTLTLPSLDGFVVEADGGPLQPDLGHPNAQMRRRCGPCGSGRLLAVNAIPILHERLMLLLPIAPDLKNTKWVRYELAKSEVLAPLCVEMLYLPPPLDRSRLWQFASMFAAILKYLPESAPRFSVAP